MFDTSPVIRDACFAGIHAHAETVAEMIAADVLDHLRRYIVLLFQPRGEKAKCKTHSSGMT